MRIHILLLAALTAFIVWSSIDLAWTQQTSTIYGAKIDRASLDKEFRANLRKLAEKCGELGLEAQEKITNEWIIDRAPDRRYVFFPRPVDIHRPSNQAHRLVRLWHRKFMQHRREQAQGLFRLARQAVDSNRLDLAMPLIFETLHEDADHLQARRILEFKKVGGMWRRKGALVRSQVARLPHPRYRFAPRKYWRIETAHFRITTNSSAKEGRRLGEKLEDLYDAWRQLFPEFWIAKADLVSRFEGQTRDGPIHQRARPKFRVTLFRNRTDYVDKLVQAQPRIGETLGIYFDQRREALFYAGDERTEATIRHEATHQLFQESLRAEAGIASKSNFWIIEGIALYFESLAAREGYATIGGFDADRMQYARHRALMDEFYVPVDDFVRLGKDDLQGDPNLPKLYSQAAGLTHFLIDGNGGARRGAVLKYLTAVYQKRDTPATLPTLLGDEFEDLNAEYRQFLNVTDDDLKNLNPPKYVKSLALGRTSVTDRGLAHLGGHHQLQWLNLSFTTITDTGIAHLSSAAALENLSLQNTQITDQALQTAGRFRQLEELDLSATKISDGGLKQLAGLTNLRSLWIEQTGISDAGLAHLRPLKGLESLEIKNSRVTPAGLQRLTTALPRLKRIPDKASNGATRR